MGAPRRARSGRDGLHFLGSATTLVGLLAGGFGLLYPDLLHSSVAPEHSLTVENSAAAPHGLAIALVWFPFALALSIAYFVVVLRGYRGKVGPPSVD